MRVIVFRAIAQKELEDAVWWYERQEPGLGDDFLAESARCLAHIAQYPEVFPRVRQEIRRAVMRRFPFTVHFLAEDSRVVVLAVFHSRRNPKRLHHRR